jgi:hypothetical protein
VAVALGYAAVAKALLADPRTDLHRTVQSFTLLGFAVAFGDLASLNALLEDGRIDVAGPVMNTRPDVTCLHLVRAAALDHLGKLRRLLQEAARGRISVDEALQGTTPLADALAGGWVEGARALVVEGGADPLRRLGSVRA